MALQMLTRMEDWAERGKKPTLVVQVPSDTGEYLMNNKRTSIARIEEAHELQITLQIRPDLDIPHYRIERQWNENNQQRVEVLEDTSKRIKPPRSAKKLKPVKPIVGIPRPTPSPVRQQEQQQSEKTSPLKSLIGFLTGQKKKEALAKKAAEKEAAEKEAAEKLARQKQQGRPRRRKRSGNRKRASGTKTNETKTVAEQGQQSKQDQKPAKAKQQDKTEQKNGDGTSGEVKKRRRRRRRRRPAAATGGGAETVNDAQNASASAKPQVSETAGSE